LNVRVERFGNVEWSKKSGGKRKLLQRDLRRHKASNLLNSGWVE